VIGDVEGHPVGKPADRALQRVVLERLQAPTALADQVVVMGVRTLGFVARDAVADVDAGEQVERDEFVDGAVDRGAPDGAVGGEWPELGYLMPSPPQSGTPPTNPLPAGKPVTLSDAIIVMRREASTEERESARQFLQMLGVAYQLI